MKNLKKALVLVLAFAMVFGMFTINASAASFTDDEDIVNTEAVSTMSQLGVINGYEDGTFLPDQIVTRAEMCKMICVALNGGKAPLLGSTAAVFSDTVGHWANDYINYCYSAGIVSGDAGKGGIFRPDATVTGLEAAKMMLVALGYNPAVAGFTGAEWANSVAMAANKKDLFEGIGSVNAAAGLTRDNAAQLVFNGINANMVEYSNFLDTVDGKLVSKPTIKDINPAETILSTMFKVSTSYGQLISVNKGALSINPDADYASKATGAQANFTKVSSDYSGLLGQTVKVMYKSATEVLGVTPLEINSVVTANASAITASGAKAKVGSATYTLDSGFTLITIAADGTVNTNTTATVSNIAGLSGSFDTVKLVDNDGDGKYEYAVQTGVATAKVTYVSNSEIVAGTSYKYADNNIADDVAKNDYVAITNNVFTGEKDIVKIEKATGAVSINSGASRYMFNGTWYNKGTVALALNTAGKIYDYYVLNGVVVAATVSKEDTSTSTANLVMVLTNPKGSPLVKEVRILNLDGTKEIVTVADDSAVAYASANEGSVYSITRTDKGVKFADPAAKIGSYDEIDTPSFSDGTATATATTIASVDNIPVDDTAKVFIYNATAKDGRVITGKQLKAQFKYLDTTTTNLQVDTGLTIAYKSNVNGLNRTTIAAAVLGGTTVPPISSTDKNYAMIVSAGFQLDSTYAQYTIWDGSSTQVVTEKISDISSTPRVQFAVITYGAIDGSEIKNVSIPTFATADTAGNLVASALVSVSSDKMWTSDSNSYNLDSKTVYMYYDSSSTAADKIGIAGGELVRADKVSGTAVPNVKYITDGADVKFVLVDIKNQLTDGLTRDLYAANTATNATAIAADTATFDVSFSRTTKVLPGEVITMTVKLPAGAALTTGLALTNAKFASNDTVNIDLTQGIDTVDRTYTFSIVCTGGAISVAKR